MHLHTPSYNTMHLHTSYKFTYLPPYYDELKVPTCCRDEDWNKCAGKAFKAKFGKLEQFYKGLDWHLGLPNPNVMRAMQDEHTKKADSLVVFSTHNYGLTSTTPAVEWEFVVNPQDAKEYPGKLRQSKPLARFLSHEMVAKANLTEPEVVAMRLYTGPMYQKYNASLRGFPSWDVEELRGNRYVTTIHAIVSGVVKLSRVWHMPELRKLYRQAHKAHKDPPKAC